MGNYISVPFHSKPNPVLKTGFYLCSISSWEKPVVITGIPANEKRFFPVWKYYTGNYLFWPCTGPVKDCSIFKKIQHLSIISKDMQSQNEKRSLAMLSADVSARLTYWAHTVTTYSNCVLYFSQNFSMVSFRSCPLTALFFLALRHAQISLWLLVLTLHNIQHTKLMAIAICLLLHKKPLSKTDPRNTVISAMVSQKISVKI